MSLLFVKFEVKGLNQERFFNRMSKKIAIHSLKRPKKNKAIFKVALSDAKLTREYIKNAGLEIVFERETGLLSGAYKVVKRYGILAGIFLFFLFSSVLSNFILRMDIYGYNTVTAKEIKEVVDGFGAGIFRLKGSVNTERLESEIISAIPEISFASVIIKGQTLIINVKEKLLPAELGEFEPLLAEFSGKIKEVSLISGTALVKPGDIVRAGDVLVVPEARDSRGNILPILASAEITAEVWLVGEAQHFDSELVKEETGRVAVVTSSSLFGLMLFSRGSQPDFAEFVLYEENFNLSAKTVLPVKINKKTYKEVVTKVQEVPFSEVESTKIEEAKQNALQKVGNYEIITQEFSTINSVAGVTTVSYVVVTERRIQIYAGDFR